MKDQTEISELEIKDNMLSCLVAHTFWHGSDRGWITIQWDLTKIPLTPAKVSGKMVPQIPSVDVMGKGFYHGTRSYEGDKIRQSINSHIPYFL